MRAFLLLSLISFASAQDELPRKTPKTEVGTGVKDATIDYFDSLADYFKNSPRAVMAIHNKGIPVEEVAAVLYIARNSTASPNQVIEARNAGKSWAETAGQNNVKAKSNDIVTEANMQFLSTYHARTVEEVHAMREKGASWIDINQEFRRSGTGVKPGKTR